MNEAQTQVYEFGHFRLNPAKRLLLKDNDDIVPLMPKAFDTLLYLVRHRGKVVKKDELMREIWTDTIVEENNLSQNISILRRILGEKRGEHRFIATVPEHGYRFVADVSESSQPEFQILNQRIEVTNLIANAGLFNEKSVLPIKTVAVLPFKPLVANNRDEALEMGMADTLIAKLSGGDIIVRPPGSVRRYTSLEQDLLAAGRELNAEAVLDGSIQTADERIRISARLVYTGDGTQLWAGQFDEKFTDIFAIQDSISEKVATALKISLARREKSRYTENVEAYQLYMKGRFHSARIVLSETNKGIAYYKQAIALDPNYALAYAGISDAYRSVTLTSDVPSWEVMLKAKEAAWRALELDETLAEASAALGFIVFFYDWDWKTAERHFRRGLALDPNSADLRQAYAHLLSNIGRHEEALAEIKSSRQLDPLNLRTNALEGQFLLHAGQTDAAVVNLQKTIDLDPNFWLPHLFAASAYLEKGIYEKAVSEGREAKRLSPSQNWSIAFAGHALAKAGRRAEVQALIDELLKLSRTSYVPPYHFALIYNALGEQEKALDCLEKGFAEKDVRMVFLKVEPKWNNLRDNTRFIGLMKRMNFE